VAGCNAVSAEGGITGAGLAGGAPTAGGVGINSGFADADLSGARSHAAIPMARAIAVRATGIRRTFALVAAMRI
jgi:hypothetical protein